MIPKTTKQIESKMKQIEDRADVIRAAFAEVTDEELCLFDDWTRNTELLNAKQFVESKAYDQSLEPEAF